MTQQNGPWPPVPAPPQQTPPQQQAPPVAAPPQQVPPQQQAPPVAAPPQQVPPQQQAPPVAAPPQQVPPQQQAPPVAAPPQQVPPQQQAPPVAAPPQQVPPQQQAPPVAPQPDPAVAAAEERIRQEREVLIQREQQARQDKFKADLVVSVEQTKQQYIQRGATPEVASMAAAQYQRAEEQRMTDYMQFQNAMQEMTAKQQLATNLNQQYGIPIEEVLRFNDGQSMEAAAIQHQRHSQDFASLQEQFNTLRDGITQQNAPPQTFSGPGGQAPPSTEDLSQYMGTVAENGSYMVNDQASSEALRDKLIADGSLKF